MAFVAAFMAFVAAFLPRFGMGLRPVLYGPSEHIMWLLLEIWRPPLYVEAQDYANLHHFQKEVAASHNVDIFRNHPGTINQRPHHI